jgi:hypothetical protein
MAGAPMDRISPVDDPDYLAPKDRVSPVDVKPLDPDYPPTDIELQIEGKSIHLNKAVLKSHSPVFRTMLESDFKEKDADHLVLKGKKYEDFIEFLQAFYPNSSRSITRKCILFTRIKPVLV